MQQSKAQINSAKSNQKKTSTLRIIGGEWRGRKIQFANVQGLRPSLDKTRETLFNWLAAYIYDSHCVDLFAGSGALGFEAASRGAAHVTLVETNKKAVQSLKKNCQILNTSQIKIINLQAQKFLTINNQKFDIVFLDPPFNKNLLPDILASIRKHIHQNSLIYIEQENTDNTNNLHEVNLDLQTVKFKQTSNYCYGLYQIKTSSLHAIS